MDELITYGNPHGRLNGREGCLETQKRAERQRAVLEENVGELRHTPEEAIAPGKRKNSSTSPGQDHPRKQGDHNHRSQTIEHFGLGKGRDRKVYDREGGRERHMANLTLSSLCPSPRLSCLRNLALGTHDLPGELLSVVQQELKGENVKLSEPTCMQGGL